MCERIVSGIAVITVIAMGGDTVTFPAITMLVKAVVMVVVQI